MTSWTSKYRGALLAIGLAAVTIFAYRPAWNGGFIWDDDYYVTKNTLLTAPDGLRRIWFSFDSPSQYFPLTYTTFRLERKFWGLSPSGYHWVNLLLHTANALLLWRLLAGLKVRGAPLAAFIFALHPVQVESVAWITERKNLLMGLFFLLSLLGWWRFICEESQTSWRFYFVSLIFFIAALSAKATACTLPFALLSILWLKRIRIERRRIFQIVPFFVLGIAMGLVAMWWERFHQGTRGALFSLGPIERLLVASHAIWFYLGKLFWPTNLTFIYPQWKISATDPLAYGWLMLTLLFGLFVYSTRHVFGRSLEVAAIFFVSTLGPVLGFIMLYTFRYTFVADHYQYLASIGPIALISGGFAWFGEKRGRWVSIVASSLIVAVLAILTWRQSATYRDIETLWRTTIIRNPGCWMAYNNLGIALFENGRVDEAISRYEQSLQIHPDYAQAHYNLATALLQKGKIDHAIQECELALALQPNDSDAHLIYGNALLAKNSVDEAIKHYARAVELRPGSSDAQYNLGNALYQKGEIDRAIACYERALQLYPAFADACLNLGNALWGKREDRRAIEQYEKALRLSPDSEKVQWNLGWALASAADLSLRDGTRAIKLAEMANKNSGGVNVEALHALAAAYAQDRQFDKAIAVGERARDLAAQQDQSQFRDQIERELKLYRSGSPYREP